MRYCELLFLDCFVISSNVLHSLAPMFCIVPVLVVLQKPIFSSKTAFFFINNIFYEDLRQSDCSPSRLYFIDLQNVLLSFLLKVV